MTTLLTLTLFAMCVIQPAPYSCPAYSEPPENAQFSGNEADFVTRTPECAQNAQDNRLIVHQDAQIQTTLESSTLGWSPPTLAEYDDLTPLDGIIIKAEPEVWVLAPEERIAALEDQIAELRKKVEALEGLGDHIVDLTAMVDRLEALEQKIAVLEARLDRLKPHTCACKVCGRPIEPMPVCVKFGHRWRNLEDVRSRHCDICGKHETLEWK